MAENDMVERVARAIYEATPFKETEGGFDVQSATYKRMCFLLARAAIEAMRSVVTLEMQVRGMEALCLYNIETYGPAKPHDECKTPNDWMARGANIAGRMQSGEAVTRVFRAMIDAALNPEAEKP